jgi:hypothetical protein
MPNVETNEAASYSAFRIPSSALTAFVVLIAQSFQRHWRVRQMGWVSLGLLSMVVMWVAAVTASTAGWGLENQRIRRTRITYGDYARELALDGRYWKFSEEFEAARHPPLHAIGDPPPTRPVRLVHAMETPSPLDPFGESLKSLILSIPQAILQSEKFRHDWAFMNYSRAAVLGAYVGFILPLFTLAYASGALGTDRESRSLIWLTTRPIPRSAIYLAKFLGMLPWCLLFSGGGFVALCLAGGSLGREALQLYWPAALAATFAFAALFHLIGAIFRRPVVVGLVYVFFFEALVAALPGSLKLLSLSFYARSLMYNGAAAAGYPVDMLEIPEAVSSSTAWMVLTIATVAITGFGMWLFSRMEYRDDI